MKCRVLKLARQPSYRWLATPVTEAELAQACRANALFDAHTEDREFGYGYLVQEARDAVELMAERTAWRIRSSNGWWSAFGRKRGRNGTKPGPPVHDDRCAYLNEHGVTRPRFTAQGRSSCGCPTSPNTAPVRASSTSARSRTCTTTGSWATPSATG